MAKEGEGHETEPRGGAAIQERGMTIQIVVKFAAWEATAPKPHFLSGLLDVTHVPRYLGNMDTSTVLVAVLRLEA